MKTTSLPLQMTGKTGKTVKYTAQIVNGKFVKMVRHGVKKDTTLSYDYGKRVYDNRHKRYLSDVRGHPDDLPKTVRRYQREPPVYRDRKLLPLHKKVSEATRERRLTREAILSMIKDIRSCTYRLAQYIFKTVLKPLGKNVADNPAIPLNPIHLVLQYSDSQLYIVYEAPDYWLGDEQITTGYLKVRTQEHTYKDVVWETCGFIELRAYMESLNALNLQGAVVIGLVGKINV